MEYNVSVRVEGITRFFSLDFPYGNSCLIYDPIFYSGSRPLRSGWTASNGTHSLRMKISIKLHEFIEYHMEGGAINWNFDTYSNTSIQVNTKHFYTWARNFVALPRFVALSRARLSSKCRRWIGTGS